MSDSPKVEPTLPATNPDNAPAGVMAALTKSGWEATDAGLWKLNGSTPVPWAEALLAISTRPMPVADAPVKPGVRTTEFWTIMPVVVTMLMGSVASMTDKVDLLPEKVRPWAGIGLVGASGALAAFYGWLRMRAKS